MARIRTIKPEFWTSEQIVECSTSARLLFVGLWNFCDDAGIHPAKPKRLKMQVFPADDFTESDINKWIGELVDAGLIIEYEAEGGNWWQVTGWHHQKIDRPTFKYPKGNSTSTQRAIAECSPPEGKGKDEDTEGKGEDPPTPQRGEDKPERKKTVSTEDLTIPENLNTAECRSAINEWLSYKRGRKEGYKKATQMNGHLKEFARDGPDAFCRAVKFSIRQGYKGLFPERKTDGRTRGPQIGPGQSYDPDNPGSGEF